MTDDHHDERHSPEQDRQPSGVSRRDFLKISGISAAVPLVTGPTVVLAAGKEVEVHGPGKVPMEFRITGRSTKRHSNRESRCSTRSAIILSSRAQSAYAIAESAARARCCWNMVYMGNDPDRSRTPSTIHAKWSAR